MLRRPSRSKDRDPHAHSVERPQRRLLRDVPLAFVASRAAGAESRSVNAPLNLTAFIDLLIVTVVFLLMTFSRSGADSFDPNIRVPGAVNAEAMLDAPIVAIDVNQVRLNGDQVSSTRAIEELGRTRRLDGLFRALAAIRMQWGTLNPGGRPFPGVCILQIDGDVPSVVVKSVFQTAVYAGYGNVSFMVKRQR